MQGQIRRHMSVCENRDTCVIVWINIDVCVRFQ